MIVSFIHIILSKKVMNILLINLLLCVFLLLYFSNVFVDPEILEIHGKSYMYDYVFESVSYLKINIVIWIVFLVMLANKIIQIDHLFIQRSSRKRVLVSLFLACLIILAVLIIIFIFLFIIIGEFLVPYMNGFDYINLIALSLLFGCYYLSVSNLLFMINRSIYTLIAVVLAYIIGSTFSPYLANYSDFTIFEQILGLFVNDILLLDSNELVFMYKKLYVICISSMIFLSTIYMYDKNDII